jgi:hypothetical protein
VVLLHGVAANGMANAKATLEAAGVPVTAATAALRGQRFRFKIPSDMVSSHVLNTTEEISYRT